MGGGLDESLVIIRKSSINTRTYTSVCEIFDIKLFLQIF